MSHPMQEMQVSPPGMAEEHVSYPATASSRRRPLLIALAIVTMLLVVSVAMLTASLVGAHTRAGELAAAERAEEQQQESELRTAERELANAEARLADVDAEAGGLQVLAEEAEAALEAAEQAAAPDDADLQAFLDLLRENNPAFYTVPDANLIELGQATCDYLDTFGNTDQNMAHVIDVGVASGIPARLSIEVTASATVVLCPHHKLD
jgi:hypothetical protein